MKIYNDLDFPVVENRLAVAFGNFDGVHMGHRRLLEEMVNYSLQAKAVPSVFLFYPHPQRVLDPDNAPKMLLDLEKKTEILESSNIKIAFIIPFTPEIASLTPEEFVKEVIVRRLKAEAVFVGFNFRFGHRASGTPEFLQELGTKYGFKVSVLPPVIINGELVSSTRIRELLTTGDIRKAKDLLGYWPLIRGKIIKGDQRGRTLGFPTANIETPKDILIPCSGVYAGKGIVDNKHYPAVVNIGKRPTFYDNSEKTIEAHLIGYKEFVYGKKIEIKLYERLREERKFSRAQDLINQIQKDIKNALQICNREEFTAVF
ncbi:MAG: bifunctional riboflavin kinase/FAD synthetase [Thermacetogeniaceae bacterium]